MHSPSKSQDFISLYFDLLDGTSHGLMNHGNVNGKMYPPFLAGPIYNSTERDFNVASDSLVVLWLVSDLVFLQLFSKTGKQPN